LRQKSSLDIEFEKQSFCYQIALVLVFAFLFVSNSGGADTSPQPKQTNKQT
jgi:hypothetical protein